MNSQTTFTIKSSDSIASSSVVPLDITSYCKKIINEELKPFYVQRVDIKDNDIILLHLNEDTDVDSALLTFKCMEEAFPKNKIVLLNNNLKGLTILNYQNENPFNNSSLNNLEEWLNKKLEEIKI